MKLLYFDCFNGASGDMILGTLLDAGLPLDELRRALGSLGLAEYEIAAERVLRAGVSATKFHPLERAGPDASRQRISPGASEVGVAPEHVHGGSRLGKDAHV